MNYVNEIIDNAEEIAIHVICEKNFFGQNYSVNMNTLSIELRAILEETKQSFNKKVTTEMRHDDTVDAIQCCKDITAFSIRLLKSNSPDKLKIALFKDLNIVGYMFDRNTKSYVACHHHLNTFLDAIENYKKSLTSLDLQIWNDSTYCGADQVPFFRGYLKGIMSSIR